MSSISVNTITDASGGATTTVNGFTPTVSNMAGRNRLINSDMRIDQRNAGASVTITATSAAQYVLDRFYLRAESATGSKVSVQRSTVAPAGFTNSQLITSLSAYTLGASEHFATVQPVEGFNVADLGWGTASAQTITVSFWVRSSLTGTFGGFVLNNAADRCFLFSYTINAANTWEYKTVTIPGDTSGTWLTDNGIGLYLNFSVATGTSLQGAAGSWSSTFNRSVTGQVNLVGTSGATFYITGVQLEAGSVATPFCPAGGGSYGQELALCQRYYWQQALGAANIMLGIGTVLSGTNMNGFVQFPVQMRTAPSLVQSTGTNYYYFERDTAATPFSGFSALNRASKDAGQLYISGLAGTSGQAGILFTASSSAAIGYSAEL